MPMTQPKAAPAFRRTADTFMAGAKTLPQQYFVSQEIFAEEQQKIFSRRWVLVGHQGQIAKPGDYFVAEVAGESLIVVRDKRGEIRGFYNVCRHRGTRLLENRNGQLSAAIQCPYHAWTYTLEFTPLAGKFSHWNLPRLRSAKRIEYEVRANWKLIFENYSECYHCPGVHPALSKLTPYDSAENDLCEGPFLGGFMTIAKDNSLTMSGNACARPVGDINAEDFHRVFYYSIFPNVLLSMHPDYVMVHRLWPQSPERTRILCDWFFHPEAFDRSDFHPNDAIEFWDMTNKQDWRVCELSQQGIASRAYTPGPYSPRESIPAAWDREYLRHIG